MLIISIYSSLQFVVIADYQNDYFKKILIIDIILNMFSIYEDEFLFL